MKTTQSPAHPVLANMQHAWQNRYAGNDKPMAAHGLNSYRYKGTYGWIMIGATDHTDALREAARSTSDHTSSPALLQIWSGTQYVPAA